MTIETWLPAVLGYLIPVGVFLLAWGGMDSQRARRSTTVAALALALATVGYFALGFAFHLGGAGLISDQPGLQHLTRIFAGEGELAWGLVGLAGFFLSGDAATPEGMALFVTYLPLVATAVLLLVLGLHGQARGWQTIVGGLAMATLLFPIAACWAWGGGWLANLGAEATLGQGHGFVDYAGSAVVYLLSGVSALGALLGLGHRLPPGEPGAPEEMPPAHFPLLANLGALLLGLGWLGWSLSEPFHAAGAALNSPLIVINGLLAGAGAVLVSQVYCWITVGHADPLMSARGAAVGWVAIAATAPFAPPWGALVIGAMAGLLLPLGVYLVERVLRLPDGTATVSLGLLGGLWGAAAVAIFADGRWGQGWNGVGGEEYRAVVGQGVTGFLPAAGFAGDGPGQLVAQLAGIGAIGLLALLVSWLLFFVLNLPYRPRRVREPEVGVGPAAEGALEGETVEDAAVTASGGWLTLVKHTLFPVRRRDEKPPQVETEGEEPAEVDEPEKGSG